jgi:hypothetical protein
VVINPLLDDLVYDTVVLSRGDAMEPLVDYYRCCLAGEHPDWDDYRRAMTADCRALIRRLGLENS